MNNRIKARKFDSNDFDYYVSEYIKKSEEYGKPISHAILRKEPFNLPDARWYIKLCPDKTVTNWREFEDWCGFYVHKLVTKEKSIKLIYKMQENINRPLMYDDFRGNGCYQVSIDIVNKYWGSLNKMKESLGLQIVQESMMDRQLTIESFDIMISNIVDFVFSDKRDFITTTEINKNKNWHNSDTLNRYANKFYEKSLAEVLKENNINLGKQGSGINFIFDDGEHTTSQYEYMFSKFLRDNGFVYNKNYFRDVKYSEFIPSYKGMMNCDYVLNIDNKTIYIEIAGIIESFKEWYYQGKIITCSKSKEKYRIKLLEKESMMKKIGLKYFILFPCDLTKDNFSKIISNPSLELKRDIESFNKHNINWKRVRDVGELKYYNKIKWGRTVIDYEEVI